MRRRRGRAAWLFVIAAVAALFLSWQYFNYRSTSRTLPSGMTIGGLSVERLTREQALRAVELAVVAPVEVTYQGQRLFVPADTVDLQYDAEQTAANLDAALGPRRGLNGFIAHVLRRPPGPVDVPVAVSYSQEHLSSFLARVAGQYDRPPQEPVPLPASLTFRPGEPGYRLNVAASSAELAAALVSAGDRRADLVVRTEEPPTMDLELLGRLLESVVSDHEDLIPGIFVKDLQSGDELGINAEIAYTGLSTLKIAVVEEAYRFLGERADAATTRLLGETITTGGNSTADLLLREVIGAGDAYQGVETLTSSMKYLGLRNTYMATPYDEQATPPGIVTPANSRADAETEPDPRMQTTALDMGLLLEMIYQCSHGGGALMVTYADALTVDECTQMIEWMSMNRTDSLVEAGLPPEAEVAHEQGWTTDTHADAALVFSPGGDFVLVVFLHRPERLEREESAPLMADIFTATYNYFNPAP